MINANTSSVVRCGCGCDRKDARSGGDDRVANSTRKRAPDAFKSFLQVNRLDAYEVMKSALRKQPRGARAAGMPAMGFDQFAQIGFFLRFHFVRLDEFAVEHVFHLAAQNVSQPSGHAGTKIQTERPENGRDATSHVFTTMLADAFHNSDRPAVANGKPLANLPGDKKLAGGGAVKNRVAGEHVAALGGVMAGADYDGPAGQPLADVIVGFTVKLQRESLGKKCAETLSRRALKFVNGCGQLRLLQAEAHAIAAEMAADAAVKIMDDRRRRRLCIGLLQKLLNFHTA